MTNPITCNTFCASSNDVNLGSSSISFSEIKTEITGGKDSKSKGKSVKRTKNDVSGGIDNKLRGKSINRSKTDLLGEVDGTERFKEIYRELTDFFDAVDNQSKVKDIFRGFIDYIEGYDTKSQEFGFNRLFSEVIELLDIETRTKTLERAFGDITDFIDTMVHTKIINRVFMDLMTSLDIKISTKTLVRAFSEVIEELDSFIKFKIFNKIFMELIDFLENPPTPILPYAKWHLNESSGTIAYDSSGNSRNGTTVGSPTWVTGKLNNSIQLNDYLGSGKYVTCGDIANFEKTKAFSVEFWMKPTSIRGTYNVLGRRKSTSPYPGWDIWLDNNYPYFRMKDANSNFLQVRSNTSPNDYNWHHVIITYDGSANANGVEFYIDGTHTGKTITNNALSTSILNTGPFLIGVTCNMTQWYPGILDEIRIYEDITLSQEQVTSQYNSGTGTEDDLTTPFYFRVKSIFRTIIDKLSELDSKIRNKAIYRTMIDMIGSRDIKSRLKRLKRKFTDRLETLDTKLRGFKKIFKEKLGGKDLKKVKNKNKVFTEKVGNLDWWYDPVVTVYGIWHMNETGLVIDNTTIAHDSSPNHTHLTCTGITSDAWMSGKLNNSLYLKTGSHVSTEGSHFSFERTDIWSFEMWFRANSIGNVDFFRKGHSNPSPPAQLRGYFCEYEYVSTAPSDKWRIEFLVASSPTNLIYKYWPYPLSNFPAGSWHHIVFTYDGSSTAAGCKCYINGAELTNSIVDNNNLTESILNYDRPHFDYITSTSMNQADEMVLWGLVLTPEEVLDRYNNGIGKELDYHWAIWLMYAGMRDTLRWFMNHGKYRYSDITEMKDTVTRIIKYSLHHGHQHWWRDKPKQKVVVGD